MPALIGAKRVPISPALPFGYHNFTRSNMDRWRHALTASSRPKILCLGDSTTAGTGSTDDGVGSNAASNGWPMQLAALLPSGNCQNRIADAGRASTGLAAWDTRLVQNGSWTTGVTSFGGNLLTNASGTDEMTFTPTTAWDTAEIIFGKSTGTRSFLAKVGGGSNVSIDCGGGNATGKTTVSGSLASQALTFTREVSTANIISMHCYNSAVREIAVYNGGVGNLNAADFVVATNPWSMLNVIDDVDPDLVIFEAGIVNDIQDSTSLATCRAHYRTVIDACRAAGSDVILTSHMPGNPSDVSYATQLSYVNNMYSAALERNVPFVDVYGLRGGTYSAGVMYDDWHPNGVGYGIAAAIYQPPILNPMWRSAP